MKNPLNIKGLLIILLVAITLQGCEINGEVPGAEYFLNKVWKIDKVVVNGLEETNVDLTVYRLTFNEDFTFDEIQIGISDFGVAVGGGRLCHGAVCDGVVRPGL